MSGRLNANATKDLIFDTGTGFVAREGSTAAALWSIPKIGPFPDVLQAQLRGDSRMEFVQAAHTVAEPAVNCAQATEPATWRSSLRVRVTAPGGTTAWDKTVTKVSSCSQPGTPYYDSHDRPMSIHSMADVDGDGTGEIFVATTGDGRTAAGASASGGGVILAGYDGRVLGRPRVECLECGTKPPSCFLCGPTVVPVRDLSQDGRADVVGAAPASSTTMTIVAMSAAGDERWSETLPISRYGIRALDTLFTPSAASNILIQYDTTIAPDAQRSDVLALRGTDGASLWERQGTAKILGDVNADRASDVVLVPPGVAPHSGSRIISARNGRDGTAIWSRTVAEPDLDEGWVWDARAESVDLLTGDGIKDVVVRGVAYPSPDANDYARGRRWALDGRTGAMLWQVAIPGSYDSALGVQEQHLRGDVDGDRGNDIARWGISPRFWSQVSTCDFGFRVLSGRTRTEIWRRSWSVANASRCDGSIGSADVDGDGRHEVVVKLAWRAGGKAYGRIVALQPPSTIWSI